ncbi:MAG TPA: 2'-5' RNA ligase family protein [Acidimicrobiales bacterium]|nr:2'-5' RNA ligase family protein [Acidimicrobiales bacterium]
MKAAEGTVDPLRQKLDPSSGLGMPAHITVLYPFAPPVSITESFAQRLGDLFGRAKPFDFSLSEIGWFDKRVMYLTPTPGAPFVDLTARIAAEFPEYPPYGGRFDEIIPHLTIGEGARPGRMRRAGHRLESLLPISAVASEVWLMAPEPSGRWGVRQRFTLGRSHL